MPGNRPTGVSFIAAAAERAEKCATAAETRWTESLLAEFPISTRLFGTDVANFVSEQIGCDHKFRVKREITMSKERVVIRLDTISDEDRWHVDVLRKNGEGDYDFVLDNGSADFPINVDDFGPHEEDILIQSLKGAFPGADFTVRF